MFSFSPRLTASTMKSGTRESPEKPFDPRIASKGRFLSNPTQPWSGSGTGCHDYSWFVTRWKFPAHVEPALQKWSCEAVKESISQNHGSVWISTVSCWDQIEGYQRIQIFPLDPDLALLVNRWMFFLNFSAEHWLLWRALMLTNHLFITCCKSELSHFELNPVAQMNDIRRPIAVKYNQIMYIFF